MLRILYNKEGGASKKRTIIINRILYRADFHNINYSLMTMMVTYHRLCAQCVFCCVTWHILPGRLCRTFQFVTAVSMAVAPSTFSRFLDKRGTGIIIHNTHTAYKTLSTYIYVCRDKPDRTTLHGVHETRQHTTRHSHILRVLISFELCNHLLHRCIREKLCSSKITCPDNLRKHVIFRLRLVLSFNLIDLSEWNVCHADFFSGNGCFVSSKKLIKRLMENPLTSSSSNIKNQYIFFLAFQPAGRSPLLPRKLNVNDSAQQESHSLRQTFLFLQRHSRCITARDLLVRRQREGNYSDIDQHQVDHQDRERRQSCLESCAYPTQGSNRRYQVYALCLR